MDSILLRLSKYSECFFGIRLYLDKFLIFILLGYAYFCTFFGVVKLGVTLAFGTVFDARKISYLLKVRRRNTYPQALILASTAIIFMQVSLHV